MALLKLRDFFHLPLVDEYVRQLIAAGPGLSLVAGLDLRPIPTTPTHSGFLPSGRATLFWILVEEMVEARPAGRCTVVTADKDSLRIPRGLKKKINVQVAQPPYTYAGLVEALAARPPGLLVIDRLTEETVGPALAAANKGLRVLSQIDTVFHGAGVARQLLDLGASQESLSALEWILTVQRMPALCPACKGPASFEPEVLARLRRQHPNVAYLLGENAVFSQATGCPDCQYSGRRGDVAVFDIFRAGQSPADPLEESSLLPMDAYILHLAAQGKLPLEDFVSFEGDQFRRTYHLLVERERALLESHAALEARLLQLEAAHRVLQRRTDALISIQDIGQALISSSDLAGLSARVCQRTCEICGADRAVLYYQGAGDEAVLLAVTGWEAVALHSPLPASQVFSQEEFREPAPFSGYPPGVRPQKPGSDPLRAGLYVPLVAQDRRVGLMIVQSTQKSSFSPGEVALLKTFSQQAALALQRAGLVEQLKAKVEQLEAAQLELAKKERLEREMELARQVQQSVLPTEFPAVPGYRFAALNEPARRVGGDFYDIFSLDDGHFGLAVADVSDKGMPAALYMTLTRSLLRAEARRERSPAAVVSNVNRLLLELGEANNFVTLFYGVVDWASGRLTYTRAGHDRPVLLRQGAALELGGDSPALGLLEEAEFHASEEQVLLSPGDRLVLYTDGLCDILNPEGIPFGRERFAALLRTHADLPAPDLCAAVFAELSSYRGESEQYDDMTLVVVEVER